MTAPDDTPRTTPPGTPESDGPVVLFDGVCNLCSGAVRFILAHERGGELRFASLQSEPGRRLLERHGLAGEGPGTMVLVEGPRAWVRSDAAVRIAAHLRAPWCWARVLGALPRPVRDALYRVVAANRYRLFGKREACMVPEPGVAERFLEAPADR